MKNSLRILLVTAVAAFFASGVLTTSIAQRRLGAFSHETKAHKDGKYSNCASCHALPTKNWTSPRRDKLDAYPDVATFPSHTSCFGCHTRDIYSNGGAFCGTCHTVPTMRAKAVLAFPIKSHKSQFTTIFPHDVHQDLIASNKQTTPYAVAHFVNASYSPPVDDDKDKAKYYSCAICHTTAATMPKYAPQTLPSKAFPSLTAKSALIPDVFEKPIAPSFFKASPTGHESCFTCHYQFKNLPKDKMNCAGCHAPAAPYFKSDEIKRYSLKFDHERKDHSVKDCTSCHQRITQNEDVNALKKADVPVYACAICHVNGQENGESFKRILNIEVSARDAAKDKPVGCTYCHTSAIGRFDVPESHRVILSK
ncbi:MAG: hypothetical protein WBC19_14680 [Pyrinomonadaceae bacterium]